MCHLILDRCEDKNPADQEGVTPLHEAADGGHQEVCHLILERCEDKNPADVGGHTPLHDPAEGGHLEVCHLYWNDVRTRTELMTTV